jgi:hypothetical protein
MNDANFSRRKFLGSLVVALPATAATLQRTARAQSLPHVDPADPTAQALHYVEDATRVDKANPQAAQYMPGQTCANCTHIQGADGDAWRPCALFPGKSVNAAGWCMAWVAKP